MDLFKHGGQNPLEAVRYNCNILHGPNVSNFNEIYNFLNNQKILKKSDKFKSNHKYLDKLLIQKNHKKI